ncbi:MAG: dihydroxyacetone kinase subunit DhaK [Erysipelothrix sp.]|jgi:dihydroxyacetone kinase-like protein|nr:dihydroxyacetone kinase subunit DhaK [Erysipelothrix sp.]
MRRLVNDPYEIVEEMLEGYVRAFPDKVKLLEHDGRVVVGTHAPKKDKVGVIVGGGSGHEPLFLGYVGEGFADAAVIGNINTSPSPEPCYNSVKAVDAGKGCIYLYGNYAGDVMNFDIGAEMAAEDGIRVETVLVTDDVISSENVEDRRGIAGDFFVFKTAAAAADDGLDLDGVVEIARKTNANCATMGVALGAADHPNTGKPMFEMDLGDMEVGMGIHGEPGVRRGKTEPADDVVQEILDVIIPELKLAEGDEVCVLVNSLGATPLMDLLVAYRKVAEVLDEKGVKVHKNFIGSYASTMNMPGMSVTLQKVDDELKRYIDWPTDAPYFVQK